jgi:hypothetical protein
MNVRYYKTEIEKNCITLHGNMSTKTKRRKSKILKINKHNEQPTQKDPNTVNTPTSMQKKLTQNPNKIQTKE